MNSTALSVELTQEAPIGVKAELYCEAGELLSLVGPSGAGKTSLLRSIAGLTRPTSGSIRCGGSLWFESASDTFVRTQQRRVGYVFQQHSLFPHLTACQNVEQALRDLTGTEKKTRARQWLRRVNLAGLENRRPSQLSGGQQQRVGLARALARNPSVLLLDEPFSSVDTATKDRLYTELASLRKDLKIPAVLVTHDLHEASILSDRLCIMAQGKTLQSGMLRQVITQPESVLLARLVGYRNVFRATVLAVTGDCALIEWRGQRLEVDRRNGFSADQEVHWCISRTHVVLHQSSRFTSGRSDNQIAGRVAEVIRMGDNASVGVKVGNPDRPPVFMSVPVQTIERNKIASGSDISIALRSDCIHLMQPDPRDRSRM